MSTTSNPMMPMTFDLPSLFSALRRAAHGPAANAACPPVHFSCASIPNLAPCRYTHTDDDDTVITADRRPIRRCLACNRELPANSRPERKFCSSACRGRHWNAANPGPAWYEEQEPRVRLHWHVGVTSVLWGDVRAGYWRGPDGCPPECPGVEPPKYTWSQAVPEGREGLPPRRDDPARDYHRADDPVTADGSRSSPRTRASGR